MLGFNLSETASRFANMFGQFFLILFLNSFGTELFCILLNLKLESAGLFLYRADRVHEPLTSRFFQPESSNLPRCFKPGPRQLAFEPTEFFYVSSASQFMLRLQLQAFFEPALIEQADTVNTGNSSLKILRCFIFLIVHFLVRESNNLANANLMSRQLLTDPQQF